MKKILAIALSLIMAFSVAAIPASALDLSVDNAQSAVDKVTDGASAAFDSAKVLYDEIKSKDFSGTVDSIFDFAGKLANAIHTLVHTLSEMFDFGCPFCDEKASETPEVPEEPTEPEVPEEPEEPAKPELPNVPAEPVHPEEAVKVESVAAAQEAIDNAEDGAYIVLADGLYDEIVITKNNITIAANNARVGFLNFNGKNNVTVSGLTFDAAYAKEVANSNKAGMSGVYANVVGTQTHTKSDAHDITIENCEFIGTPVDADNYTPININDYKRKGVHAYNVTVDSCSFEVDAVYYLYFNYHQKGTITVTNNVLGGEEYSCAGMMWLSSNGSDLVIKNNVIYNWNGGAAIGTSRSGAAYDIKIAVENNAFVQTAEDANTTALYLKNYKASDLVTLATFIDSNSYFGTISAENVQVVTE